ncbi:MAG: SDR family NAD(P)-dependent oxidoreductase [bacterium]|nr:SDR family NAD(P)-dependent oxidoreductase [bacterium]
MRRFIIRYISVFSYVFNGGVSPLKAFVQHFIVPVGFFIRHIPVSGVVIDLGCGEGILTNLLARLLPEINIYGIDPDKHKIETARRNAPGNVKYIESDIFNGSIELKADLVILNDIAHCIDYEKQLGFLDKVAGSLKNGGKLILKEVDQDDFLDKFITSYFSKKFHPADSLACRTIKEWISILNRVGLRTSRVERVRRIWPSARTVFIASIPINKKAGYPDNTGDIKKENLKVWGRKKLVVFITGATGFTGRHVSRLLLKEGLDGKQVRLIILVRSRDRLDAEFEHNPDVVPLSGDLHDLPYLRDALTGVHYVFHLAAETRILKGDSVWRNNYYGTLALLKSLDKKSVKRIVFASDIRVVGRGNYDHDLLDESSIPDPVTEYDRSKLKAEIAVRESGLDFTILRIPWVYGEGMGPDQYISRLVFAALEKRIFSFVNFKSRMSVITVSDLSHAFLFLASDNRAVNENYFVTDGQPVSPGDMLRLIADIIGCKLHILKVPDIFIWFAEKIRCCLPVRFQILNRDVLAASNKKLSVLGFKLKLSKKEGVRELARSLDLIEDNVNEGERLVSVVTGAGSGLGTVIAKELYKSGHRLLLIDEEEGVRALAEELNADSLVIDFSSRQSLEFLVDYIQSNRYVLDWVINNESSYKGGVFNEMDFADLEVMIMNNCLAPTFISYFALNHFKKKGWGRLINISSAAAFQPLPLRSVYAATRSYLMNLSLGLSEENLSEKRIGVFTFIISIDNNDQHDGVVLKRNRRFVSKIMEAVRKNRVFVITGSTGKLKYLMSKVLPVKKQLKFWYRFIAKKR